MLASCRYLLYGCSGVGTACAVVVDLFPADLTNQRSVLARADDARPGSPCFGSEKLQQQYDVREAWLSRITRDIREQNTSSS